MLVLSRRVGQSIIIADEIEITVVEVKGDQIRLGIKAPQEVSIYRKELLEEIKAENKEAACISDLNLENLEKVLGDVIKSKRKK